uniref:Nuclear apoptosis-inducing factor 1 n=1 Tax=Taenia asiatica TaxID=60517 RepID=A0A0R3W2K7_TAEAS
VKRYHTVYVKNNIFECCHWQPVFNPCFAQQETVAAKNGLNKLETNFEKRKPTFEWTSKDARTTKHKTLLWDLLRFACDGNVQWRRKIREKWEQTAHHNQGSGPFAGPVVDISKQVSDKCSQGTHAMEGARNDKRTQLGGKKKVNVTST